MSKNIKIILALAVTAALVVYALCPGVSDKTNPDVGEDAAQAVKSAADNPDLLPMALKRISLSQGQGGLEEWRLKADWAKMRVDNEIIDLEKPKVVYFMSASQPDTSSSASGGGQAGQNAPRQQGASPDAAQGNDELHVESDFGYVDQTNSIISFKDNVKAVTGDNSMLAARMLYNGTTRQLTLPEGAVFSGPGMDGRADKVTWTLDKQTIEAEGNVDVDVVLSNSGGLADTPDTK